MTTRMTRILCAMLTLALVLMTGGASAATFQDTNITGLDVFPMVKEPVTLTIGIQQNSYVTDYKDNAFTKLIEETTGINLEFVIFPEAEASTKLMLMINAGTELPDVICGMMDDTMCAQAADAGVLLSLDAYFDKETGIADTFYATCERNNLDPEDYLALSRSSDGHIYTISQWEHLLSNMYCWRAWINQDWLNALDLEMPATIDELTEVLKAFRDGDPNGNGIKDEIPMTGSSASGITSNSNCLTWLQNLFIYRDTTGNLFLPLSETGGKLDVSYDKEAYREFLKYVNMLVAEDLLDEAAFTQTQTEMRQQLQADTQTIGMMFGSANGFGPNIASWQPLPQPEGFYGTKIVSVNRPTPSPCFFITTYCENPEVAFLFCTLNFGSSLGEYYWQMANRWGEKDIDWRWAEEGEESIYKEIGIKPLFKVYHLTWAVSGNKHWQLSQFPSISGVDSNFSIEVFDENEAYGERLHARSVMLNRQYAPELSDVVGKIIYTQEERDQWDGVRSALRSYIIESSALFAVGQMDPNSDADWQRYLDELDVLSYQELLAMDEAAYKRTWGK